MTDDEFIAIGKSCIDTERETPDFDDGWRMHEDEFLRICRAIETAEREACAKVCEDCAKVPVLSDWDVTHNEATSECAAAIRARSNVELTCRQQPAQEE